MDADTLTHGQVAGLFNAYVACSALTAACDLGVLDQLERDGKIPLPGSGGHDDGLDEPVMLTLLGALQWAGVVEIDGHAVTPGPTFREAYAARGYFLWLVRGCGEVFSAAARLAVTANRTGSFYRRDMGAVATGSHLIGEPQVEPLFDQILSRMQVRKIADLGCGSAARLIRIASRDRHVTGIGLDISPAAVQLATQAVAARGLAGRIRIGRADVRELRPGPELADVDTVTCVFMGHDFWPQTNCVRTLRQLRTAFPAARRLLLCDVVRTTDPPGPATPIFALGFETVHALMGVHLPTLVDWYEAFTLAGWQCLETHPVTAPPNGYLFELAPGPQPGR